MWVAMYRARVSTVLLLAGASLTTACGERTELPPLPEFLPDLPPPAQAVSLLNDTLAPAAAAPDILAQREAELAEARRVYDQAPTDVEAIIWLGRRLAYLGRYREAIAVYTRGIALHPNSAHLYRHRGHRFITLRMFDRAIADLAKGAKLVQNTEDEIEPDGQPNARGIPLSTLQFNIWYHLGLAHYLSGDFPRAETAYRMGMEVSRNPDLMVATLYWLYHALVRQGKEAEARDVLAPVTRDLDIIENGAYHRLLLLYRGAVAPDSLVAAMAGEDALQNATLGYGVARWYAMRGDTAAERRMLERILAGSEWAAFGYLAAEADVARAAGRR